MSDDTGMLQRALRRASVLMGSARHEMRASSESDGEFTPPPEIQDAARRLSRWMAENGHRRWQMGDVCDRAFVLDLCEVEARMMDDELGVIQRSAAIPGYTHEQLEELGGIREREANPYACSAQESALKRDGDKIMKRSMEMMARQAGYGGRIPAPDQGPLTGYNTLGEKI